MGYGVHQGTKNERSCQLEIPQNRTVWLRGIRRRRKLRPGTGSFVGVMGV
jgi:hypothetical protein